MHAQQARVARLAREHAEGKMQETSQGKPSICCSEAFVADDWLRQDLLLSYVKAYMNRIFREARNAASKVEAG